MKKIKTLCGVLALLCVGMMPVSAQNVLKFNADKKFKIVQFTDVHWVPGDSASEEAAERMNEVLDVEKPDLVIYTGDLVFGKPASEALSKALEPVVSRRLPFAVTWGNHDDEQDMTRIELLEYIKDMPGNLTSTTAGISGVTNYVLPLKSEDGKKDAAVLYVFDSNAYSSLKQVKGYDWIKPDQINWYVESSVGYTERNGGKPLPSLAFFHIPFPEYNEAAQDENALLIGTRKEKACAPLINTGLYAAMLNAGDIMATFVGHDHVNDYVVDWKGILLCYGRFTGGNTVYHDIPGGNGARVIELTQGVRSFKTWERLEGGVTDVVIGYLNDEREHIVFMLWGDTQKKGAFFDRQRHCVLTASHPAPLSADRRFFGCQHFSKANEYFRSRGLKEIE